MGAFKVEVNGLAPQVCEIFSIIESNSVMSSTSVHVAVEVFSLEV